MKKFRKTEAGLFICEECEKIFPSKASLSRHVNIYHIIEVYYDKWLKEENEGICKICGKKTKFIGFSRKNGYDLYCSKICINKGRYIGTCLGNEKLYGVKNPFQREDVKNIIKETNLKNLGVEYAAQSEICKNKQKQTYLKNYGVEHNMQNKEIFEKQQISAFKAKKYLNTIIYYRGSYELDFLNLYYNKYPNIENGPSIKYIFEDKYHYYFPDFFISSLNLIIEIKSSYYYEKFKDICIAKQNATISNGFNYIMILDKNYKEFNLAKFS